MLSKIKDYFRQSFTHRMFGVGIMLLLPLLFVCWNFIAIQQKNIEIATIEKNGIEISKAALSLKLNISREIINLSNNERNNHSYKADLETLKSYTKNHDVFPISKSAINAVDIAINQIDENGNIDDKQAALLRSAANHLIRSVASDYLLVLDPQLDSYSLMDFSIQNSIDVIDSIENYIILSAKYNNSEDKNKAIDIASAKGGAEAIFKHFYEAGILSVKNSNGSKSAALLNNNVKTNFQAFNNFFASAKYDFSLAKNTMESLENSVFIALDMFEKSVENRRSKLVLFQYLISSIGISLFIIAFWGIFTGIKRGIVWPIKKLTASMSEISAGVYDKEIEDYGRKDEVGEMMRALKILRDNSVARINAEQSAKAKSEFLAIMSHEIRTPMNGVLGMAQALSTSGLNQAQKEMTEVIIESGQSMVTLLNDILDMSKIEAGKIEIENIKMSPCAIIKGVIALHKAKAENSNLDFEYNIAENANGWYKGDPNRIRQLLNNLISNAVKFTKEGKINVDLSLTNEGNLRFSVKDTGIGIPKEKLALLFQKFTQLDSSHSRIYGGTGLGLSICAGLIKAMGGKIWVESEAGKGSNFIFEIAAIKSDANIEIECDNCEPCQNNACIKSQVPEFENILIDKSNEQIDEIRILVAEDNETNQLVLKTLFTQIDINAVFVANGHEAFETWVGQHYDVIIMDMQMPVWDGVKTIKAIREWESKYRRPRTAIIACSANSMREQIAQQINAGADGFCANPLVFENLMNALGKAIQKCESMKIESYKKAV